MSDHSHPTEFVELEKVRYAVRQSFDKSFLREIVVHDQVDQLADTIVFHLEGSILGDCQPCAPEEVPVDWWDAFKSRWFPGWLKRRYPPRFRTVYKRQAKLYVGPDCPTVRGDRLYYAKGTIPVPSFRKYVDIVSGEGD